MEAILYSRPGCHLCEQAKEVLLDLQTEYRLTIFEANIDEKEEWTERFGLMIPVIEVDGEILQYGQIDHFSLSKRLHEKTRTT